MAQATFATQGLSHHISGAYISDPTWRVYPVPLRQEAERLVIEGIRGEAFILFVTLEVVGFGRTCVPVDGTGEGLEPGNYDLAVELLRSRAVRAQSLAANDTVEAWDAIADDVLSAVEMNDTFQCSDLLGEALIAVEELLYQQAERNGPQRTTQPILSATLFGERRDQYAIGVGPDWPTLSPPDFTRDPRAQALALDLINGTTLPTFWRYLEFEQGRPRWERVERILEQARDRELRIKSFALYWGGIGGCPPWFRDLRYGRQLVAIERWVTQVVTRYQGVVHCWETVNEMHNWCFGNPFGWSHTQLLEVTQMVNELVGALDPGTPRLINHCCIWGDYVQTRSGGTWSRVPWRADWTPLAYLDAVHAQGIPFEAIGLQYYNPGRDLATCYETLAPYAAFGKTIQLTEIGTPAAPAYSDQVETGQTDPMSGWRGTWSEARQALWLGRFYTIMGAHPQISAFNYWDFDDAQAFIHQAGLVDAAYRPKAGYQQLQALAQQWR
ncbi:MAG: endo-1,4-beta-xylanase [Caldilineaceae bacterium]|nr:endo-1,4-beta-xylanase [Caldilineaceae bacterium]